MKRELAWVGQRTVAALKVGTEPVCGLPSQLPTDGALCAPSPHARSFPDLGTGTALQDAPSLAPSASIV